MRATREEEQEQVFLGMQAAVPASCCSICFPPPCLLATCSEASPCLKLSSMQPSQGDKEAVAIDGRIAAQKRAAQVAAQEEYERAVGAEHALLLKEEGNSMRQALQEKVSMPTAALCLSLPSAVPCIAPVMWPAHA